MTKKQVSIALTGLLVLAGGIYAGTKYIDSGGEATVTVPIVAADTTEQKDFSNANIDVLTLPPQATVTEPSFDVSPPLPAAENCSAVYSVVEVSKTAPVASCEATEQYCESEPQYKDITLCRIDFSGDYAFVDGVTPHNIVAVYLDGKQISLDRAAVAGDNDRIDVFDAKLDSVVTARIVVR